MDVNIDTSQIGILKDFFDGLSHIDQKKILMSSFRRAAKPLVAKAKELAPFRTGQGMRSIGTIEYPQDTSILVGTKLAGGPKKSGWYMIFSEPGEGSIPKQRFRKKFKGQRIKSGTGSTGIMKLHRFMEPAYEEVKDKMYDDMTQEWYDAIDKFIIRTNKLKK